MGLLPVARQPEHSEATTKASGLRARRFTRAGTMISAPGVAR